MLPVLLVFKEQGGFDLISKMLERFCRAVIDHDSTSSKESFQANRAGLGIYGIKAILDLLLVLTNHKYIAETAYCFSFNKNGNGRIPTMQSLSPRILLELRSIILPSIRLFLCSDFL